MKKRILPALVCILMLLQTLFLLAPAASAAGVDAMDNSYVVDDLNKMGVDITKYKGDAGNDRIELLVFTEFGYKINGDFSEYGLYLYLWNPSGVKLEDSDLNCIQLLYGLNSGGTTGYRKYGLEILSWSTGSGYEYVFYKVKIKDSRYIAQSLNKASRYYEVSGVEILRNGNANATDYKLGGSFTFTGYHEGCNSNGISTLWCDAEKIDVVELELHPVSYYSKKYANLVASEYDEVFGVYFSVPDWVVKRYGNLDDENLKGLDSVKGVYKEARTNGILTDSDELISLFENPDIPNYYIYFRSLVSRIALKSNYYLVKGASAYQFLGNSDTVEHLISSFVNENVFRCNSAIDGISASAFAELYRSSGKSALERSNLKYFTVTSKDVGTVDKQNSGFWNQFMNTFRKSSNSQTMSFDMLQRITKADAGVLNAKAVSEKYKVTEGDADDLKSFALQHDNTYVLHFAVRDCTSAWLTDAGTLDPDAVVDHFDEIDNIGDSYYFEKTVFEDFDILELTFRNKENKMSVVPVSASPIDVTGGIPSPGADNPNEKPSEDKDGTSWWDLFNSLETWIKVVAVIALFVLLFLAFRLFGGFFGFVGRIVTAPFRLLGKGISSGVKAGQSLHDGRRERKAQREHDEDRAEAKIDRERNRKREDRADELNEKKSEAMFHFAEKEKSKDEKEKKQ